MKKLIAFGIIIWLFLACEGGSEIGNPLSPPDSNWKRDTIENKGQIIFIEKEELR